MFTLVSMIALLLVAVTMGLSLAHALEFPGKRRLDEATYKAVQAIYYPGFTIGGLVGEFGSLLMLPLLLFMTPTGAEQFWWIAGALGLMVATHAIYWIFTHPVNSAWLKDTALSEASDTFFKLRSAGRKDWRHMRDVWEWSHVARALGAAFSFLALAAALMR